MSSNLPAVVDNAKEATAAPVIVEEIIGTETSKPVTGGPFTSGTDIMANDLLRVYPEVVRLCPRARANAVDLDLFISDLAGNDLAIIAASANGYYDIDDSAIYIMPRVARGSRDGYSRIILFLQSNYALIVSSEEAMDTIRSIIYTTPLNSKYPFPVTGAVPDAKVRVSARTSSRVDSGLITTLVQCLYQPPEEINRALVEILTEYARQYPTKEEASLTYRAMSTSPVINSAQVVKAGTEIRRNRFEVSRRDRWAFSSNTKLKNRYVDIIHTLLRDVRVHWDSIKNTPWLLQQIRTFICGPTLRSIVYLQRMVSKCIETNFKSFPFADQEFQAQILIRDLCDYEDISDRMVRWEMLRQDRSLIGLSESTYYGSGSVYSVVNSVNFKRMISDKIRDISIIPDTTERFDAACSLSQAFDSAVTSGDSAVSFVRLLQVMFYDACPGALANAISDVQKIAEAFLANWAKHSEKLKSFEAKTKKTLEKAADVQVVPATPLENILNNVGKGTGGTYDRMYARVGRGFSRKTVHTDSNLPTYLETCSFLTTCIRYLFVQAYKPTVGDTAENNADMNISGFGIDAPWDYPIDENAHAKILQFVKSGTLEDFVTMYFIPADKQLNAGIPSRADDENDLL